LAAFRGLSISVKNHIVPQWGDWRLDEIERVAFAVEVEQWLKGLRCLDGRMTARGTKAKIRNIMSAVFSHAKRCRFVSRNPVEDVRQSARRERMPEALTADELYRLMLELKPIHRLMLLLMVPTGTRRGEVLAIQWKDINWFAKTMFIYKTIWRQHLGPVKTVGSEGLIPLDDVMLCGRQKKRWVYVAESERSLIDRLAALSDWLRHGRLIDNWRDDAAY